MAPFIRNLEPSPCCKHTELTKTTRIFLSTAQCRLHFSSLLFCLLFGGRASVARDDLNFCSSNLCFPSVGIAGLSHDTQVTQCPFFQFLLLQFPLRPTEILAHKYFVLKLCAEVTCSLSCCFVFNDEISCS